MNCEQQITVSQEPNEQQIVVEQEPIEIVGGGAVKSVNGKTGHVVLDADDVGAIGDEEIADFTYDEWDQLWQAY